MFGTAQRRWLRLGALLPLLVVLGCSSSATGRSAGTPVDGFPVTVLAANGSVTVPSRPHAIVSLSPTATEMLYAIGAGHQVKAVDKYSDYPPGAPMTALDGNSPNVEAIAAYKPDLVVLSEGTASLDQQFKDLHIPVIDDPAASDLQQAYAQFVQLGQLTGHTAQAKAEVSRIKGQVTAIVASAPRYDHPVSYYYELDQTYFSVTSSTFIGQVLGLVGLKSIADAATGAASSGGYPQLNAEFILQSDPDYVFLADTLCCAQSPTTVAARPGWSSLAAVQNHRVLGLNDDIASRWGPRIVVLLRDVVDELKEHPLAGAS